MNLCIAFITGRIHCQFDWFFQSLARQPGVLDIVKQIVIVDFYTSNDLEDMNAAMRTESIAIAAKDVGVSVNMIIHDPPKPNIWQGPHRIVKDNWWAASNARNTALCLCEQPWIAFLDDRMVLCGGWLDAIVRAMDEEYAVCGAYEKRVGMKVDGGIVTDGGAVIGVDNREAKAGGRIARADGGWWYGCTNALQLDWALQVNGYEELMDGMSFEDVIFGRMLENNGFPIRYDPQMKIIEDRTPGLLGEVFRREDKGVSPNDKSHKSLELFATAKRARHIWPDGEINLRDVRERVLAGSPFSPPEQKTYLDWYDGSVINGL